MVPFEAHWSPSGAPVCTDGESMNDECVDSRKEEGATSSNSGFTDGTGGGTVCDIDNPWRVVSFGLVIALVVVSVFK